MRKSKSLKVLLVFVTTFAFSLSCSDQSGINVPSDGKPFDAHLQLAIDWFNAQSRSSVAMRDKKKVEPVWAKARIKTLVNKEYALLVPSEQFVLHNTDVGLYRGFIFFIKGDNVRDAVLLEFYGVRSHIETLANELLLRYAISDMKDFAGAIISYDVTYNNPEGSRYQDGIKIGEKVALRSKENGSEGGRTQTCYDVFLITFYSDGSEEYLYLYSYCEGEQSGSEPGGGSSGGSGSGSTTTTNGTTQITVEVDGKVIVKEWKCFGYQQCGWSTVAIIIPKATIESNPPKYSYLPQSPINGQAVFSQLTNLVYEYDGASEEWTARPSMVLPRIDPLKKIANIYSYLDCFNEYYSARLTIYIDQPEKGSEDCSALALDGSVTVGHTFIGIQQGDNVKVVGFYPDFDSNPLFPIGPGALGDDQGHNYDVAVSVDITGPELMNLVSYVISHSQDNYNLNQFNCSDFSVIACGMAGVTFPPAWTTWPLGPIPYGLCPGKLGEVLRGFSQPSRNSSIHEPIFGAAAPNNYRTCNLENEEN